MNRKTKLFFSLVSLCFSIAVLCFGVYSAMSVSYQVTGNVSYNVQDVFVKIDLSVYKSTSQNPLDLEIHKGNITTIQNAPSLPVADTQVIAEMTDSVETYNIETGEVINPGATLEDSYNGLDFVYGAPDVENTTGTEASTMGWYFPEDNKAWAFYVVLDITNYGEDIVNAKITNNTTGDTQNTYFEQTSGVNIPAKSGDKYGSARLVIGLAVADVTKAASGNFSYTVTVDKGQATFGYDNISFDTSKAGAVIESVSVDGVTSSNNQNVAINTASKISLGVQEISPKQEITTKIAMHSTTTDPYQRVRLTYSNLPEGLRVNSTSIFLPQSQEQKIYTIKFYNQNSEPISLENVEVKVSLESVQSLLMHDTEKNYYYVEMGTVMRDTENEYIRWRYIADENRTSASGTPSDLSQLNGTYLLETDLVTEYLSDAYTILMQVMDATGEEQTALIEQLDNYLANNYTGTLCAYQSIGQYTGASGNYTGTNTEYSTDSNDYKTSTIRRYMNYSGDNTVYKHADFTEMGPTVFGNNFDVTSSGNQAGGKSNMVTDLNIDIEQDVIYNEIFARSLTNDLYADIGASNSNTTTGTPIEVPSVNVEGLTDTNSDKFWLLSVAEANTLFPSGSAGDSYRDWNGTDQPMDEEGNLLMDIYWLRSPYSSDTGLAYFVADDGDVGDFGVIGFGAARPAFQIS